MPKTKSTDESTVRNKIFNRVSRIEGQVRGIKKMIEDKKDCSAIINQISAIKQAVNMLATELLGNEMVCRFEQGQPVDKKYLADFLKLQ